MLGAHNYHGGLGDGNMRIFSHLLSEFLLQNVDGERVAGVNWFVKSVEVSDDLGL